MFNFGEEKKPRHHYLLKAVVLVQILVIIGVVTAFGLYYVFHKSAHPVKFPPTKENKTTSSEVTINATTTDVPSAKIVSTDSVKNKEEDCPEDGNELCGDPNQVLVYTNVGPVQGTRILVFKTGVEVFLGIPYASPPIGQLRFRKSVKVEPWKTSLEALNFRPSCVQSGDYLLDQLYSTQVNLTNSEDCLYLNIWTPKADSSSRRPVMVWIHGGDFSHGSVNGPESNGEVLATFGDVVVVTFNYRLGPLGFLNLGLPDSPGNQGLFDQQLALEWVKANIEVFGGDPDKITLFGDGAGAVAIGLHMISPISRRLFKRAILQSGSPLQLTSLFERNLNASKQLAKALDCSTSANSEDREAILNCLHTTPTVDFGKLETMDIDFGPTKDEEFLPLMPSSMVKDEAVDTVFKNIEDVLIGVTKDEASFLLVKYFKESNVFNNITSMDDVRAIFDLIMSKVGISEEVITSSMKVDMSDEGTTNVQVVKQLYDAIGNILITCPSVLLAQELTKAFKNVYFYVYNHRSPSYANVPKWMGVSHGSMTPFLFGLPLVQPIKFKGHDIELSKRLMKSWSEFARSGKPAEVLGLDWFKYTSDKEQYMEILTRQVKVKRKYHGKACAMFREALLRT